MFMFMCKTYAHLLSVSDVSSRVVCMQQGGDRQLFRVKRTAKIGTVMDAYCAQKGLDRLGARFLFDGKRIQPTQTPTELEMEDEDVIDAFGDVSGDIGHWGTHEHTPGIEFLQSTAMAEAGSNAASRSIMRTLGATSSDFRCNDRQRLLSARSCAALVHYADARAQAGERDLKLELTRDGLSRYVYPYKAIEVALCSVGVVSCVVWRVVWSVVCSVVCSVLRCVL